MLTSLMRAPSWNEMKTHWTGGEIEKDADQTLRHSWNKLFPNINNPETITRKQNAHVGVAYVTTSMAMNAVNSTMQTGLMFECIRINGRHYST